MAYLDCLESKDKKVKKVSMQRHVFRAEMVTKAPKARVDFLASQDKKVSAVSTDSRELKAKEDCPASLGHKVNQEDPVYQAFKVLKVKEERTLHLR
jgi:hypothetical protein